jgi:hypothetical protein
VCSVIPFLAGTCLPHSPLKEQLFSYSHSRLSCRPRPKVDGYERRAISYRRGSDCPQFQCVRRRTGWWRHGLRSSIGSKPASILASALVHLQRSVRFNPWTLAYAAFVGLGQRLTRGSKQLGISQVFAATKSRMTPSNQACLERSREFANGQGLSHE